MRKRRTRPLDERFWEKVDRRGPDECWPWTAYRKQYDYGMINIDRRPHLAHRVAYELSVGPIPAGLEIMHKCDNPPCCNPEHLRPGTHKENMADSRQKNRHAGASVTHCPRGHEYTPDNIYWTYLNGRMCKICAAARRLKNKRTCEEV